jgi:hypothetical protein
MKQLVDRRFLLRGFVVGAAAGLAPALQVGAPPPDSRPPTRDELRRKLAAECAASGQWEFRETAHYFLVVQSPRSPSRRGAKLDSKEAHSAFVAELEVRVESARRAVREFFPRDDGDPNPVVTAPRVVRAFRDRDSYYAYGAPAGSTGYWNPDAAELVVYDSASNEPALAGRDPRRATWRALNSMTYFAYIAEFGEPAPPPWFHEGHASYFAGFEFVAGEHVAAPDEVARDPRAANSPPLSAAQLVERFSKGGSRALREFEFEGHRRTAWALVWSLRQAPATKGAPRAGALDRWWGTWLGTRDALAAKEAAFKGVDWSELDGLCARALEPGDENGARSTGSEEQK